MSESAGLHIIMDARVTDPSVFDKATLLSLFGKIVKALGMKPLDDVKVYEVPVDPAILARAKATGNFEDEGGISTLQVISTSHIALHAWPLQSYFALDAFSCKDYNAELALTIVRKALGVKSENTLVVERQKTGLDSTARNVQYFKCGKRPRKRTTDKSPSLRLHSHS